MFTRTTRYHFPITKAELKSRLIGKHLKIHNLDFEVFENGGYLTIAPHAEQINTIKTLPVTNVELVEEGNGTKAIITSKMRKLDSGGPQLVVIFCSFLFIASFILLYVGDEKLITFTLLSIGSIILAIFSLRMQTGYFDYVRKVRAYVKDRASSESQAKTSATSMVA
jgi:hypothetical protein